MTGSAACRTESINEKLGDIVGRLDQKVALVTGAGQGVGQGVAFALAKDGASVAVVGRTESKLIDTCDQIKEAGGLSLPVVCDVTEPEQVIACVDEVVDHFGRLDILINNAQVYKKNTMLESNDDEVYEAFDSGPMAAYRFMRKAYPQLKERKGVIVNMGSGAQLLHEGMRFGSYMAAKYAMLAFTRTAAVEWGKDGIPRTWSCRRHGHRCRGNHNGRTRSNSSVSSRRFRWVAWVTPRSTSDARSAGSVPTKPGS